MYKPPPDTILETTSPFLREGVKIYAVGLLQGSAWAEVIAGKDQEFFRLYVASNSRNIRRFWKAMGIADTQHLRDGVYDCSEGYGNFHLSGILVGFDNAADADSAGVSVLEDAALVSLI